MSNKSTTKIKPCIIYKKFCKKSLLQACVYYFSLFSPNDRNFIERVSKRSVPKASPKPLINFCQGLSTNNFRHA